MNKEELRERLKNIVDRQERMDNDPKSPFGADCDADHLEADKLLLDYIDDEEAKDLFNSITKWYS